MDILSSILSRKTAKQTDFKKVLWLLSVMKWFQQPRNAEEKTSKKVTVYTVRLKYLLLLLDKNPEWKENFVKTISGLLYNISSVSQFASVGLTSSTSFVQDFIYRLQEKILPKRPLNEDLSTLISEIFPHESESEFIDFIDAEVLEEVVKLFANEAELRGRLQADILSACYVLSVQILSSVFTIQQELNDFTLKPSQLPEFHIESTIKKHQIESNFKLPSELLSQIDLAEKNIERLNSNMKERGVKIELVYHFENQKRKLRRLRILINFLANSASTAIVTRYFISNLVLDLYHQKSLRSFLSENLALLTERIVQANSHIGEHYVTFTWPQFRKMFRSAMGGGAITAITVFIKTFIARLHLTGFIKGFTDSMNYSSSFLLIQILGWTLATKQPSATAPYIASSLKKSVSESRRSIVALLRTQFIAVMGNLSMVFPICFLISFYSFQSGYPILNETDALTVFESSQAFSFAPLYAAFTGILLFIASLIAGWFENWVLTTRLSNRLMNSESLDRILGTTRAHNFANFVATNSNALAANISLGFLLGMIPPFLKFLGIPLDVRHVTLATGSFATSLPTILQLNLSAWDYANSILGILAIGVLNISTSFAIAFLVASLSSKVKFTTFFVIFKWGIKLILTRPWLLIVPEKGHAPDHHAAEHK